MQRWERVILSRVLVSRRAHIAARNRGSRLLSRYLSVLLSSLRPPPAMRQSRAEAGVTRAKQISSARAIENPGFLPLYGPFDSQAHATELPAPSVAFFTL